MAQKSKNTFKLTKEQEAALQAAKGVFRIGKTLYLQFKVPDRSTAQKKSLGYQVTLNNIKLAELTLGNIKIDIANGTYKNDPDAFWQKHFPMDTAHLNSGIGIEELFAEYSDAKVNHLTSSTRSKLKTARNWLIHYKLGLKDIATITSDQMENIREATVVGTIKKFKEERHQKFMEELKNCLGEESVSALKQSKLEELKRKYNEEHVIKFVGCKVSSVYEYTKTVKQVFDYAVKKGYLKVNPACNIGRLAEDTIKDIEEDMDVNPFSGKELESLLAVIHVPLTRLMVKFLAWTGLRHGELKALAWEDIHIDENDLKKSRISVKFNLTREGTLKRVKTKAGIRKVALLPAALEVLKELKKHSYYLPPREEEIHANNQKSIKIDRRRIFLRRGNEPFKRPELTNTADMWKDWLKSAGLTHRPPYQLRHTYASRMLMKGANPIWLAKQMGHKDTSMIFKVYGDWIDNEDPNMVETLASSFGQQY